MVITGVAQVDMSVYYFMIIALHIGLPHIFFSATMSTLLFTYFTTLEKISQHAAHSQDFCKNLLSL